MNEGSAVGSPDDDLILKVNPSFRRLYRYLLSQEADAITLSRVHLDALIDRGLPPNALSIVGQWWTNNPRRAYARSWVLAGWMAEWSKMPEEFTFRRGRREPPSLDWIVCMRAATKKHTEDYLLRGPPGYDGFEREWWKPHVVYVIHYESQHLYKAGITKVGTARIRELCSGGRGVPVQVEGFANRHAAVLVECEILSVTDRWRDGRSAPRHSGSNRDVERRRAGAFDR